MNDQFPLGIFVFHVPSGAVEALITVGDMLDGLGISRLPTSAQSTLGLRLDGNQLVFPVDFDGGAIQTEAIYLATFALDSPPGEVPSLSVPALLGLVLAVVVPGRRWVARLS